MIIAKMKKYRYADMKMKNSKGITKKIQGHIRKRKRAYRLSTTNTNALKVNTEKKKINLNMNQSKLQKSDGRIPAYPRWGSYSEIHQAAAGLRSS